MSPKNIIVTAFLLVAISSTASAGTIYTNEYSGDPGNCLFNSQRAATYTGTDTFAAQRFTLSSTATALSGSFVSLNFDGGGTSVNWKFYDDDGAGGLPGTLLGSGNSLFAAESGDLGGGNNHEIAIRTSFDFPSITLAAGSYFFAVQYVTPHLRTYLVPGVANSGGAQTNDGGASWTPGFQGMGGVAVALYDTHVDGSGAAVPEPAAWAMMLLGFGGMGAVLRNRRRLAVRV